MPDPVVNGGTSSPNPNPGSVADPAGAPAGQPLNSGNPAPVNSGTNDVAFKELQTKVETLTRQYEGSTKEALRLKEENEKLKKQVEEGSGVATATSEDDFQKLIDKHGVKGAFDKVYGQELASMKADIEGFKTEKSVQVLNAFEATHPGMQNEQVKAKFEAELAKLKGVYSLAEAMEKAYLLAGGKEAEANPSTPNPNPASVGDPRVINQVANGAPDNRPAPVVDNATKLQTQINDLTIKATQLQIAGRVGEAMVLLAQVEDLKGQLGAKV